jgi:hypothetical protein
LGRVTSADQAWVPQASVIVEPLPAGAKLIVNRSAGPEAWAAFIGTRATSSLAIAFV